MHLAVNTVGAAALGAALACAIPMVGAADPGLKFEGGPWLPALAIVSGAPEDDSGPARTSDRAVRPTLFAFVVDPDEFGESAVALERTLDAADSRQVAIPAQVRIATVSGGPDSSEEVWAPAVLVVSRADVEPSQPPAASPPRSDPARDDRRAEPRDETERWVPALALATGILGEGSSAHARSRFLPFGQEVRPPATGSQGLLDPWASVSLELMSPSPGDLPGRPRFFVHGDVGANFGFDRDVAKEGSPAGFQPPDVTPPVELDEVVEGQGSTTTAEPRTLLVGAGAGLAFTVDVMGRRIRVKPSIEYLREELKVSGVVKRATIVDPGQGLPNPIEPTYAYVDLRGNKKQSYHGLGAGLELEMDTARAGPLMLTLFMSGQAYRILSDRTTTIQDGPELPLIPNEGVPEATWTFTKDPWTYRAGLGVRFRWLPE